jgi:hypothetical protein
LDRFEVIHAIGWEIYYAASKAKVNNAREVAILLDLMVRHHRTNSGEELENLKLDELTSIAKRLGEVSAPLTPKKRIGALTRGRKPTRAGLLCRYQSFLIQNSRRSAGTCPRFKRVQGRLAYHP